MNLSKISEMIRHWFDRSYQAETEKDDADSKHRSGFLRALIFGDSDHSSGKQKRTHTALLFAFIFASLSNFFYATGGLEGLNDYLMSLIVQVGYSQLERDHQKADKLMQECPYIKVQNGLKIRDKILILKKDEKTSQLINTNPGRREFASIIEFLGKERPAQTYIESKERLEYLLDINFGLFDVNAGREIRTSYDFIAGNNEKGKQQKSLVRFQEYFYRPKGNSVWGTFGFPRAPAIFEAWKLAEVLKDGASIPNEIKKAWHQLINVLILSSIKVTVSILPNETTFLRYNFAIVYQPQKYFVKPARVMALDFVLQGEKSEEDDARLEKTLDNSSMPVVIAAQIRATTETTRHESQSTEKEVKPTFITKDKVVIQEILPAERFLKKSVSLGFINITSGVRDFVNSVSLFVHLPEKKCLQPSFVLMTAAIALDREKNPTFKGSYVKAMRDELDRIYDDYVNLTWNKEFHLGDIVIPCGDHAQMLVPFVGSTKMAKNAARPIFPSVSFYQCFESDLLTHYRSLVKDPNNQLDPHNAYKFTASLEKNCEDLICLAGPFELTDFDYYPTPLTIATTFTPLKEPLMGIEIHANALASILERRFLRPPNVIHTIALGMIVTLLLGIMFDVLSPFLGAVFAVAGIFSAAGFGYVSYHHLGRVFHFSPFLFSIPLTWSAATLVNYLRQRARAQNIKSMFSRFVAADVVQYMVDHPELVKPGGQKVQLTIFFSDVAGFTSISEALTPEELVVLLNEYLGAMTDLLFKYGGTLDKFIGDAVMAFWNYPTPQEDHAVRACLCAIEMQETITRLQQGWAKRGLPKVAARAGMNSANVVVGYMGSVKAQMNFTCMGDGVNLASRLEGANKEYGTYLMVSDATYQQAKDRVTVRFLDYLAVKGKKEPVKVHELICEKGKEPAYWSEFSAMYDTAIQLHLDRKWDEAIAQFEAVLARWPDDGPSKTYINRCKEYKVSPPPENWDGRYILTHK